MSCWPTVPPHHPHHPAPCRGKMYELLANCIPPDLILKRLLEEILPKIDDELKAETCMWAATYEARWVRGVAWRGPVWGTP